MSRSSLLRRAPKGIGRRVGRLLVERMGLHPSFLGYSYVPRVHPAEYALERSGIIEEIEPPRPVISPLPRNVTTEEALCDARGTWGLSFRDHRSRVRAGTYLFHLPSCRVVAGMDRWQNEFFSILTEDHRSLEIWGTGLVSSLHRTPLLFGADELHERAAWILEWWAGNYFHWLVCHLPKVALLDELGLSHHILLSRGTIRLEPVIRRSFELFGIDVDRLPKVGVETRTRVQDLVAVSIDPFPARLLHRVRERLTQGRRSGRRERRIFSSRSGAAWRRLVNEDEELWPLLKAAGYERVRFEELAFDEQIDLVVQADTIVGGHGAGLANMLFAPTGARIVELGSTGFPAAQYYGLATALGHEYWWVAGEPAGNGAPKHQDFRVERAALERLVDGLHG